MKGVWVKQYVLSTNKSFLCDSTVHVMVGKGCVMILEGIPLLSM